MIVIWDTTIQEKNDNLVPINVKEIFNQLTKKHQNKTVTDKNFASIVIDEAHNVDRIEILSPNKIELEDQGIINIFLQFLML